MAKGNDGRAARRYHAHKFLGAIIISAIIAWGASRKEGSASLLSSIRDWSHSEKDEARRVRVHGDKDAEKVEKKAAAAETLDADLARAATGDVSITRDVEATEEGEEGRLVLFEVSYLDGVVGRSGSFILRTRPSWAPIGVARFEELVNEGFYEGCRSFRVLPNFIVQFGINGEPEVQRQWRSRVLKDDPVSTTNARGTVTFATSGKDTRTVQLFINTGEKNAFLDREGFSPFAEVVSGMDIVDRVYNKYREKPDQGKIQNQGNAYLSTEFPLLSYFTKVAFL